MNNALAYTPHLEFDFFASLTPVMPLPDVSNAKPFIKWVGGKSQLIPDLFFRIPSDLNNKATTYIEPFIGGGAFFFWLIAHGYVFQKVIINDANPALVNAYQVIRDMPEEVGQQH